MTAYPVLPCAVCDSPAAALSCGPVCPRCAASAALVDAAADHLTATLHAALSAALDEWRAGVLTPDELRAAVTVALHGFTPEALAEALTDLCR